MGDAIVRHEGGGLVRGRGFAPSSFAEVYGMAERLAEARGFVPKDLYRNPGAVAACILTGLELGLGPMEALRSIHMVEGKATLSAELMLAIALRSGVRATWLETTNKVARVRLERDGHEPMELPFTIEDAKTAGLASKGVWQKYPAAMLRARCLSGALRAFCPDVIGSGVYVEGEIEPDERPERREPRSTDVVDVEASCAADVPDTGPPPGPARVEECKTPADLRAYLDAAVKGKPRALWAWEDPRKMRRTLEQSAAIGDDVNATWQRLALASLATVPDADGLAIWIGDHGADAWRYEATALVVSRAEELGCGAEAQAALMDCKPSAPSEGVDDAAE